MLKTLAGKTILVTRPQAQSEALLRALTQKGAQPLHFPLFIIKAIAQSAIDFSVVKQLESYDIAFFVSANAVQYGVDLVRQHRDWPSNLAVATVGHSSANALRDAGFTHVIYPDNGFDSEAVLALPEFSVQQVAGKKIVVFCGNGGRQLLAKTLQLRNAQVDRVCCYWRCPPGKMPESIVNFIENRRLDAIILTSSEAVSHLVASVDENVFAKLRQIMVFAPHPRIVEKVCDMGFHQVCLTEAGDVGLLCALETQLCSNLS